MDYKQSKHSVGENNILFKNIDKITNSELKNELWLVLDSTKNKNLGNYRKKLSGDEVEATIDLSKFLLIATTSTSNPQLPKELRDELKHVEPVLDKYFWIIFLVAGGLEVIIFLLIRRSEKRKLSEAGKTNFF